MSTPKKVRLLCEEKDREALRPVLEALAAKGLRVSEGGGAPARDDVVLAVLSESFYADSEKTDRLLSLVGSGAENVLPLQLDAMAVPDTLKNALYARNIISAAGRDPALIAERIAAALPEKKSGLPRLLVLGGIVLLAVVGILIWRSVQGRESVDSGPEATNVVLPAGLTMEDLEQIEMVQIVGDKAVFYSSDEISKIGHRPDWDEFAYRNYDETGAHFYSREDGHEYPMTRYDDLSFLSLMPKLNALSLCVIDVGMMPDMSGATRLRTVGLMDCAIPDLDWLSGAPITKIDLLNSTASIRDFSPLNSCENLRDIHIDVVGTQEADLSNFAPPALERLWINNGRDLHGNLDLSGLLRCEKLQECELEYELPIENLSFLAKAAHLRRLTVDNISRLRDVSALGGLKELREFELYGNTSVTDFSALAGCTALERVSLNSNWDARLRDVSFLSGLPGIKQICLNNLDLPDLEFLRDIGARNVNIELELSGDIDDYSALSAVALYDRLVLDPDNGVGLDQILPWLEGSTVYSLTLRRFSQVDLSQLTLAKTRLELDRCGITDLSTMPENWKAVRLNLNKCSALRSLDGLQNQDRIGRLGIGNLEIFNCPRLTDWSALEGMDMSSLSISGGYTLPDFSNLTIGRLELDRVEDVTDLHFLDGMQNAHALDIRLVGLDALKSLEPLRRFHGHDVSVPPQLAEQAADLVKAGNYFEYNVVYPEGGWELDNEEFSLLSLDELETMPPALLRRVNALGLVGDTLYDAGSGDIWQNWDNGKATLTYHSWIDNSETPLEYGPGIVKDFDRFRELTGLRRMDLYEQPLKSLDGIQDFPELESFRASFCHDLTDASAVFACQQLRSLNLDNTSVSSIQGIQNLNQLVSLNINGTRVTDLSPLNGCDFSAAVEEEGGFWLCINALQIEDYSPLASVPVYSRLEINDADCADFAPFLEGVEIRQFCSYNCFTDRSRAEDVNALFADFVRSHPELEEVAVPWNQAITDLTPLLELENLRYVRVCYDMPAALESLEGQNYAFQLEIEG